MLIQQTWSGLLLFSPCMHDRTKSGDTPASYPSLLLLMTQLISHGCPKTTRIFPLHSRSVVSSRISSTIRLPSRLRFRYCHCTTSQRSSSAPARSRTVIVYSSHIKLTILGHGPLCVEFGCARALIWAEAVCASRIVDWGYEVDTRFGFV